MKWHYGWSELKNIDFLSLLPIILPLVVINLLLMIIALIDLYRHRDTRENVIIWTVVIIFINVFGPMLYFIIGRKDGISR